MSKLPPLCPTPEKTPYHDEQIAQVHLAYILKHGERRGKMPARVYFCECGAWHLTSLAAPPAS